MNRTIALLTGAGLGAGLMYFLDPNRGRSRRARIRDRMVRASHQIQDARDVVVRDVRNRMHVLAAGDLSIRVGGKNAPCGNLLRGAWSPTGRAMLGADGSHIATDAVVAGHWRSDQTHDRASGAPHLAGFGRRSARDKTG